MKMPVPIVAPTPNSVSWNNPIERASSPCVESVPASAVIAVTGLRRSTCCVSDAILSSSVAWRVKLVARCATRSRAESKSDRPPSSVEQLRRALRLSVWMRILITSNRGAGHIEPLVPFARALLRAGDDVLVAAPEGARTHIERAALPFFALADPPDAERDAAMAAFARLTNDEQGVIMLRDVFADIYARASLP